MRALEINTRKALSSLGISIAAKRGALFKRFQILGIFALFLGFLQFSSLRANSFDFFCLPEPEFAEAAGAFDWLRLAEGSSYISSDFSFDYTGSSLVSQAIDGRLPAPVRGRMAIGDAGFELEHIDPDRIKGDLGSDLNRHEHGTGSVNVALEASQISDISALFNFEDLLDPDGFRQKLTDLKNSGQLPEVVNLSYSMGNDPRIRQSIMMMLNDFGITVVASAGNDGDDPLDANNRIDHPGIFYVGSMSPYGLVDTYSQVGEAIDILAPVGEHLGVNFGSKGESAAYGTSFASPQVAAAISDLKAILPDLNHEEVRSIVQRSAITTINTEDGVNGAGMLNHLRMVEVALKIRENPQLRNKINDPSLYRLSDESAQALALAEATNNKQEKLQSLQRAFLLDPESVSGKRARAQIAQMEDIGLMSEFYKSLDIENADAYLQELAQSQDDDVRALAQRSLSLLGGERAGPVLAAAYTAGPDQAQQLREFSSSRTSTLAPRALIRTVASDVNDAPEEQQIAALNFFNEVSDEDLDLETKNQIQEVYESLGRSPSPSLRRLAEAQEKALQQSEQVDYPELFGEFSRSPNAQLRRKALSTTQYLPTVKRARLSSYFLRDPNADLAAEAQLRFAENLGRLSRAENYWALIDSLEGEFRNQAIVAYLDRISQEPLVRGDELRLTGERRKLFEAIFFGEPKALMPFIRLRYQAMNSVEQEALETELGQIFVAYQAVKNQPQQQIKVLKNELEKRLVHRFPIVRIAADQALDYLPG